MRDEIAVMYDGLELDGDTMPKACTSPRATSRSTTSTAIRSPCSGARSRLLDRDLGVVSDQEPVRARLAIVAGDGGVAPEQRRLHAPVEVAHRRAGEQDRVLNLRPVDRAPVADCGVGTDVAVREPRVGADDRRAPDRGALQPGAGLDHDAAVNLGL